MNVERAFFHRGIIKKSLETTAEERGLPYEVLEELAEELRKNVVMPLETLYKNRPSPESEDGLEKASKVFNVVKTILISDRLARPGQAEKEEKVEAEEKNSIRNQR
jgi:hypothetical protein